MRQRPSIEEPTRRNRYRRIFRLKLLQPRHQGVTNPVSAGPWSRKLLSSKLEVNWSPATVTSVNTDLSLTKWATIKRSHSSRTFIGNSKSALTSFDSTANRSKNPTIQIDLLTQFSLPVKRQNRITPQRGTGKRHSRRWLWKAKGDFRSNL